MLCTRVVPMGLRVHDASHALKRKEQPYDLTAGSYHHVALMNTYEPNVLVIIVLHAAVIT